MRFDWTHEYQGRVEVIMIFLVEVSIVLVCLLVEHLVEVATGVRWWFTRWRELFDSETQGVDGVV